MSGPVIHLPEKEDKMGTDFVVSFLSSVPASVQAQFQRPTKFLAVPAAPLGGGRKFYADYLQKHKDGKGNVIPGLFKAAGGSGEIGRVAVIGFSNGCDSGVSQLLQCNDARKIDFVGAFDGIHGSFVPGTKRLSLSAYNQWIAYAMLAAGTRPSDDPNTPVMVITHSSIEPTFPSTTETAALIWDYVTQQLKQEPEHVYPYTLGKNYAYPATFKSTNPNNVPASQLPSWTWQSFTDGLYVTRKANNLTILGWGDPGVSPQKRIQARCRDTWNNTADHVYQAQSILPQVLSAFLVERWNPICSGSSGVGGGIFGSLGDGASCTLVGKSYDEGPEGPLPGVASPIAIPTKPLVCPYPPSGETIVGGPGNACATSPSGNPPPYELPKQDPDQGKKIAFIAMGAAAAYGAYRGIGYLRERGTFR